MADNGFQSMTKERAVEMAVEFARTCYGALIRAGVGVYPFESPEAGKILARASDLYYRSILREYGISDE